MANPPTLTPELARVASLMENFEATESVANTGTGSRREGGEFETLVGTLWMATRQMALTKGATLAIASSDGIRRYSKLTIGHRSLYLPTPLAAGLEIEFHTPARWLDIVFGVSDLIAAYPSEAEAIHRYAPESGKYSGEQYPNMYSGMTTQFDDTIVLEENGILREKILLEYKTAKSSKKTVIDGNAHERLSFQIMQYLEIAPRYPRCSLLVLANGAFVRYRNKYHVNFHVQADRLANFSWFSMEHACTGAEYTRFLSGLLDWLFDGTPRLRGGAR